MKEITKELIDASIDESVKEIADTTHKEYMDIINGTPEEYKNNPLYYNEMAIVVAQTNAVKVLRDTLYKLFTA